MTRDANIPLVLWLSTAIVFHLAGGGGASEAAHVAQDQAALRTLTRGVREQLHPPDTTFEVMTDEAVPTPAPNVAPPEAPEDPDKDKGEKPDPEEAKKPDPEAEKVLPTPPPKPEPPKKDLPKPEEKKEPPKPEPLKPLKPVPVVQLPPMPPPPPPPPPPPLPVDHRLAVKQNVAKDQEDNPNANRIADEANTVAEETMAKLRSHDQDDPNPSPGKPAHAGPKGEPGNDDHDKVADSETKKGDPTHAPGEAKEASTAITHDAPPPPQPPTPAPAPRMGGMGGPKVGGPAPAPVAPPPSPGGAGPASPEVVNNGNGNWSMDPENPGGNGKSRRAGKKRVAAAVDIPLTPSAIGFGQGGLSLNQQSFEAAIGAKTLKQERAADGAARRSAHRGAFETNKFDRYRAAIENYDPSVKAGNQTALNAARVPFASYINAIHNRIHPIFAEQYLASLESMPKGTAMAAADLVTHVEIVLNKEQGRIVRLGITKASGVTAFDVAALDSVNRAQPYGKAPDVIVSPDGNVYLHWEFHRDPFDACSTRNASPFLLATAPKDPAKPAPPRRPGLGAPRDEAPLPGPLLPLQGR